MAHIDELDLLKTLDPAAGDIDPHGLRARADLQRILSTDPAPLGVRPRRNRRLAKRVALGTGLVAATTTAAIVLPPALGGDKAFATWTAVPTGMSAADSASASASCRDNLRDVSQGYRDDLSTATTAISERRGAWTLVVLADQNGFSALCVTDDSRHLFRSFFGSIGSTASADRPGRRGLLATDLGAGSIDGKHLSAAIGLAGSDVTGVTYTSATRGKVSATVAGGHFALWFPGDELEDRVRTGVPLQVTYRDGTTTTTTLTI